MLRLWRLSRAGMGGGALPEPGGTLDQSPYMMDAFAVMDAAKGKIEEERRAWQDSGTPPLTGT
jgi:hypothetical protein